MGLRQAGRFALVLGAAVLVMQSSANAAPDPKKILLKAEATMDAMTTKSRSFQATIVMSMSMGKAGSVSTEMRVISVPGKKMRMDSRALGKPQGMMAMAAAQSNRLMIDDGKTLYMYMPAQKQYMKRPSAMVQAGKRGIPGLNMSFGGKSINTLDLKYLGIQKVNGRPAYVIRVSGKGRGPAGQQSAEVFVDQATSTVAQVKASGAMPSRTGKPETMTMTVKIIGLKANVPAPDSLFKFIPPRGVTEFKAPAPGGQPVPGGHLR